MKRKFIRTGFPIILLSLVLISFKSKPDELVFYGVIQDLTSSGSFIVEAHIANDSIKTYIMDYERKSHEVFSGKLLSIDSLNFKYINQNYISAGICKPELEKNPNFKIRFDSLSFLQLKGKKINISSSLNSVRKIISISSNTLSVDINMTKILNKTDRIKVIIDNSKGNSKDSMLVEFLYNKFNFKSDIMVTSYDFVNFFDKFTINEKKDSLIFGLINDKRKFTLKRK